MLKNKRIIFFLISKLLLVVHLYFLMPIYVLAQDLSRSIDEKKELSPLSNIVQEVDYSVFLTKDHIVKARGQINNRIEFWRSKLKQHNYLPFQKKLADLLADEYKITGNVEKLSQSDELLQSIHQQIPQDIGILYALCRNAISRHSFIEAQDYINQAYKLDGGTPNSILMKVDVLLERGYSEEAAMLLGTIPFKERFSSLIRHVKLSDQLGQSEQAIAQMEQALEEAESSKIKRFINWSTSNLADMYGHQGRIKESYNMYLQSLAHNPADTHALKGIAWIALSFDKNVVAAKDILHFLRTVHPIPDYDLMLAEIASFEGDDKIATIHKNTFIAKVAQEKYGHMYRRPIALHKGDVGDFKEAIRLAKQEVDNRPHPMSFDLLAWVTYQSGEQKQALNIIREHVMGKTTEPLASYHIGTILAENNKLGKAQYYLTQALDSSFELGPTIAREIANNSY